MRTVFSTLFVLGIFLLGLVPVTAVEDVSIVAKNSYNGTGKVVTRYGEGVLYQYGSLNVVELHGSYREMGRQYGAMRKDILNDIYNDMSKDTSWLSALGNVTLDYIEKYNKEKYAAYPNYNEIMKGIAETSGLGDKTYVTCTIYKEFSYMLHKSSKSQCSFDAAWGPYTSNSPLVAGRNYDLGQYMSNNTEIVVYNFDDGSIPVAVMGYVGSVYITSGFNNKGLFLELNDGSTPYTQLQAENKTSNVTTGSKITDPNLELFELLQKSANLTELELNFANAGNTVSGAIINVADEKGAFSYEWIPSKYVKRAPQEKGLLAATNVFIDPSWGLKLPAPGSSEDAGQSVIRLDNILNLSNQNKGKITPEVMMQIISTSIPDGGPLFPDHTTYEMVVVPQDLKIWFRVPNHYNWTGVDLKNHFDA